MTSASPMLLKYVFSFALYQQHTNMNHKQTDKIEKRSRHDDSNENDSCDSEEQKKKKRKKSSYDTSNSKHKKAKREKQKRKKQKNKKHHKETKEAETVDDGFDVPISLMNANKEMTPVTKEEWEKNQNIVRRVFDEASGRYRLIKGSGEVIEEIVSKERHKAINQQATRGDGAYFQTQLSTNLKQ